MNRNDQRFPGIDSMDKFEGFQRTLPPDPPGESDEPVMNKCSKKRDTIFIVVSFKRIHPGKK
jgi:hypothetical protein